MQLQGNTATYYTSLLHQCDNSTGMADRQKGIQLVRNLVLVMPKGIPTKPLWTASSGTSLKTGLLNKRHL